MKYREWDPLQLSSEIDSGTRVVKQSVSFDLFRTYRRKISWNPIAYQNFGIFYGRLAAQRIDIIRSMAKRSEKFHQSVNISLYTFEDNERNAEWDEMEDKYTSFFHHPFKDSFEKFLIEISNLRDTVEEETEKSRIIEPSNKVLQIVLLDLDDEQVRLLNIPENLTLFLNMIKNSYYQRIYIGFFAKDADKFSTEVHEALDISAYLGTVNDEYCHSLYERAEENEYSRKQILIGTGYIKSSETLINLHPLKFTPNEAFLKAQQGFEEEDRKYMQFLNGLDDGTVTEVEK